MWIQAFLLGKKEQAHFFKRTQLLLQTENLQLKIQEAREKVKKQEKLSEEDNLLLEIPAFVENLILYQDPQDYQHLFGKELDQSQIKQVSEYTLSKELENKLGDKPFIQQIHNESLLMGYDQLAIYFSNLQKIIKNYSDDIVISLATPKHRIGIYYDKEKQNWVVINTNEGDNILGIDENPFDDFDVAYYVSTALYKGLRYKDDNLYNVRIFASPEFLQSSEYQSVQNDLQKLQQENLNAINQNIIAKKVFVPTGSLISKEGVDAFFATQAVVDGDFRTVQYLIDLENKGIHTLLYEENTIKQAFKCYYPEMLSLLCPKLSDEQLGKYIHQAKKPIHIAVERGDTNLFDYLLTRAC